ncbi:hypothetical protein Pfo_019171 [Paulownia fortunei]|nr:hypothetical protein Pfo_019171 [Paulownia fortunei]
MSNLTKLEFIALDISGNNYLAWTLNAEIYLDAMNLGKTIKEGNEASLQDRIKAMIFPRHHLHEELKTEYLTVKDPYVFWKKLKERYEHKKTIILPKARYDWMHLQLQDFKSVSEYNSAMFKITSQLKLCGEKRGFKKYFELISCILVVEQNNELLMKNHQSRPTGSMIFPEVNAAIVNNFGHSRYRGSGRGHGHSSTVSHHQKWENNKSKQEENGLHKKLPRLMKAIVINMA